MEDSRISDSASSITMDMMSSRFMDGEMIQKV